MEQFTLVYLLLDTTLHVAEVESGALALHDQVGDPQCVICSFNMHISTHNLINSPLLPEPGTTPSPESVSLGMILTKLNHPKGVKHERSE
jgi:hypothetical protein